MRHEQLGLNSALYLPLLRGDDCVGVLVLGSKQANAFNHKAIALAESFRDQALIAIENTRLFNETQEALEQQTATAGRPARHQQFADRRAAGVRHHRRRPPCGCSACDFTMALMRSDGRIYSPVSGATRERPMDDCAAGRTCRWTRPPTSRRAAIVIARSHAAPA